MDDFVFDATDHALLAKHHGAAKEADDQLVALILRASSRAATSTGFEAAKRYLSAAQGKWTAYECTKGQP